MAPAPKPSFGRGVEPSGKLSAVSARPARSGGVLLAVLPERAGQVAAERDPAPPSRRAATRAEAAKLTWADPAIRARRTAAIRAAWDDPLKLALARARKPRWGRDRSREAYNAYFRAYRARTKGAGPRQAADRGKRFGEERRG